MHSAFASMNTSLSKSLAHSKKGRTPPARIDPSAASMAIPSVNFVVMNTNQTTADRPFLRPELRTHNSVSSGTHGIAPVTPGDGRKSSFRLPPRSSTLPLPQRPPSPDFTLSQDCAFPPFPTTTPRSTTPKTPSERQWSSENGQIQAHTEPANKHTIINSRANSEESVIQKLNKIVPGPFNMSGNAVDTGPSTYKTMLAANDEHESTQKLSTNVHQLSTSDSGPVLQNCFANKSGGLRSGWMRSASDGPLLSTSSTLPQSFHPHNDAAVLSIPETGKTTTNAAPSSQSVRSQALLVDNQKRLKDQISNNPRAEQISEPPQASHIRGSSVAAANRPLHEIGSITSFKPFRGKAPPTSSLVGHEPQSKLSSLPRHGDQTGQKLDNAPPVPKSSHFEDYGQPNPYHSLTKSTSSNESSASETNSGSSRSSPPRSEMSYHPWRKPSDTSRIDNIMIDIHSTISNLRVEEEPQQARRGPPPSFSRPLYARPPDPLPPSEAWMQDPESPMDPAIRGSRFSPTSSQTDLFHQSQTPPVQGTPSTVKDITQGSEGLTQSDITTTPPTIPLPIQSPHSSSSKRRTTTVNKGNCRGCNEPIKGKSVSSADGRLTGHYHKRCFVCKTCREPFQSADFYVIGNHPYCSRHYHQLNGSLCRSCDRGIEGQYLETEVKQKYHPQCFTCLVGVLQNVESGSNEC